MISEEKVPIDGATQCNHFSDWPSVMLDVSFYGCPATTFVTFGSSTQKKRVISLYQHKLTKLCINHEHGTRTPNLIINN